MRLVGEAGFEILVSGKNSQNEPFASVRFTAGNLVIWDSAVCRGAVLEDAFQKVSVGLSWCMLASVPH